MASQPRWRSRPANTADRRLAIGFNHKTNQILFSGSWGEAHALKRMPADNAFPMTTGWCYIEPLR